MHSAKGSQKSASRNGQATALYLRNYLIPPPHPLTSRHVTPSKPHPRYGFRRRLRSRRRRRPLRHRANPVGDRLLPSLRPVPGHLSGAGEVPDGDRVPEVRRGAERGGRRHHPGRREAGRLPEGVVAVVRGGGGERDGLGNRRRRRGGWTGREVRGETGSEEERDGELEPHWGMFG